jgi:formylglycine-generating enzyme required for sulfatase activity
VVDDVEDSSNLTADSRVMRGGSFDYLPFYLRSAFRHRNLPANRLDNLGFRVARTFR